MSFGASLHPTETAGDGKTIVQSRYPKPGDPKDRRVNCSQCGFSVDMDRRATGDDLYNLDATIITITQSFTPPRGTLQSDTFGEPQSDTGSGCPLCRSMNVTGVGRGKRFGSGINLEGR